MTHRVLRLAGNFILFEDGDPIGRFSSRESARAAAKARAARTAPDTSAPGCYPTKRAAADAFLRYGPNEAIAEAWGGADMPASGGEFDALNEMREFKGKRRVATLRRAVETSIPGRKPPYCLPSMRLDLVNETTPVRESGRRMALPDDVAETLAERGYADAVREAEDAESGRRHHGRPGARARPVVQKTFPGRVKLSGPRGPGFPLTGAQCEDAQGRIRSCADPRAVGKPVRVEYRPKVDGARPRVLLRPTDKTVGYEARARADREALRHAAAVRERKRGEFDPSDFG